MKVRQQLASGIVLELDVDSVKDAVREMAGFQEVFAERSCGQCGQPTLVCSYRKDKEGNEYFGLRCTSCGCELSFGQHREGGTLFAKRTTADGVYDKEHRGWKRYEKQEKPAGGGDQQHRQPKRYSEF